MVAANPQPNFPRVRRTGLSLVCSMIFGDVPTADLRHLRDTTGEAGDSRLPDARNNPKACAGSPSPPRERPTIDDEAPSRDMKRRHVTNAGPPVPALLQLSAKSGERIGLHSASSLPCDGVSPPGRSLADSFTALSRPQVYHQPTRACVCGFPDGCTTVRKNDEWGLHFRCAGCEQSVDTSRCLGCRETCLLAPAGPGGKRQKATCACMRQRKEGCTMRPQKLRII